jgi:hypothetical protein
MPHVGYLARAESTCFRGDLAAGGRAQVDSASFDWLSFTSSHISSSFEEFLDSCTLA